MSAKTFDMDCMTKNLSQMMGSTCEAFAVIDYANNYVTWVNECKQEMGEEVSEVTASGWLAQQGLLGGAQGKYRGWSEEGMELYHRIVELLDEQHKSEKHGVMLEVQLRKRWKEKAAREEKAAASWRWRRGCTMGSHLIILGFVIWLVMKDRI